MRFDQKIAVITGASKGIGKAVATRLASEGGSYGHGAGRRSTC
jgi:NAD(P)-dependent dehydrogenase (short-subunit alcohol dehydrogenase family)